MRTIIEQKPNYNDYLRVYIGDGEIIENRIDTLPDEVGRKVVDLNEVFEKQTRQLAFYESIKKRNYNIELNNDQMKAFMYYYEHCQKNGIKSVINPRLIHFVNRGYHLFNQVVSHG